MTLPATPRRFTVEEYLAIERAAESRSEYIDGQIYAMTGASRAHNLITLNLASALHAALSGSPCEVYASDMRVKVADTALYAYPDVVVACPPLDWLDGRMDTLGNPVVIVEVLSPSTEGYDRGPKFLRYQRLAALRHYVMISQDALKIEHYRRDGTGWRFDVLEDAADVLALESIGAQVGLAAIYARVSVAGRSGAP